MVSANIAVSHAKEKERVATDTDLNDVLVRHIEAWNRHDLDGLMDLFAEDCVFESSGGDQVCGTRYEGWEQVKRAFADVFSTMPDAHWGYGFPIGGVVTRPEILESFCETTGYFNTFGGNPVAAAAGLAVLDVIEDEGLIENASRIGGYMRAGLREIAGRHPSIGDVRGAGLFIGIEFSLPGTTDPDPATTGHVINELKERGVLISAAGAYGNVRKVRPPLCFSSDNADLFLETLDAVLSRR